MVTFPSVWPVRGVQTAQCVSPCNGQWLRNIKQVSRTSGAPLWMVPSPPRGATIVARALNIAVNKMLKNFSLYGQGKGHVCILRLLFCSTYFNPLLGEVFVTNLPVVSVFMPTHSLSPWFHIGTILPSLHVILVMYYFFLPYSRMTCFVNVNHVFK